MKSGATDSDNTGSEAGTMVIQAPFIIAPTHQASASAKKSAASASGDEASVAGEGGPQPLVLAGPSGAGRFTFYWPSYDHCVDDASVVTLRQVNPDQEADGSVQQQLWILGEILL